MLPGFLMDKTLTQLRTLRDTPAYDMAMVQALIRKTDERDMIGDWGAQAASVVETEIKPALARQISVFEALRPNATNDAGAWKLPQGDKAYALALRAYTTTDYNAQAIHDIGLDQVASIQAEIDTILKGMGMAEGSVGERIKTLSEDPQHLWPNTDEAKVELIGSLNEQMAALAPLLPRVFNTLPTAAVEIRRVPPAIDRAGRAGRLLPGRVAGWDPARRLLHQPVEHGELAQMGPADPDLSRGFARSSFPDHRRARGGQPAHLSPRRRQLGL